MKPLFLDHKLCRQCDSLFPLHSRPRPIPQNLSDSIRRRDVQLLLRNRVPHLAERSDSTPSSQHDHHRGEHLPRLIRRGSTRSAYQVQPEKPARRCLCLDCAVVVADSSTARSTGLDVRSNDPLPQSRSDQGWPYGDQAKGQGEQTEKTSNVQDFVVELNGMQCGEFRIVKRWWCIGDDCLLFVMCLHWCTEAPKEGRLQ